MKNTERIANLALLGLSYFFFFSEFYFILLFQFILLQCNSNVLHINVIFYVAAGLTLAPLVLKVDPNLNVVLTACITVFVGCYRSVKPTAPTVCNCHA